MCITCGDNFYVNNYGQCMQNPIYCKVSNQFGQCLQCINGFMSMGGVCTREITYCQNYTMVANGQNTCLECYVGYYLKDQLTCARLSNGCASANSSGYCLQCY